MRRHNVFLSAFVAGTSNSKNKAISKIVTSNDELKKQEILQKERLSRRSCISFAAMSISAGSR